MNQLINDCSIDNLMDVLAFHHQFELIHPFQDGNGRVGRIIMFRQCLEHNLTPFIIPSDKRDEYIDGLKSFSENPDALKNEIESYQDNYQKIANPFLKNYLKGSMKNNELER